MLLLPLLDTSCFQRRECVFVDQNVCVCVVARVCVRGTRSRWCGAWRRSNEVLVRALCTFCHSHQCIGRRECGWWHSHLKKLTLFVSSGENVCFGMRCVVARVCVCGTGSGAVAASAELQDAPRTPQGAAKSPNDPRGGPRSVKERRGHKYATSCVLHAII